MVKIRYSDLVPKNPRQIRYNMQIDSSQQTITPCHWTFFILNAEREGSEIAQKISKYFSSHTDYSICEELEELESGILVKKDSLLGKLITLKSNIADIRKRDRPQIYDTEKWHYDRRLGPMNYDKLNAYCDRLKS